MNTTDTSKLLLIILRLRNGVYSFAGFLNSLFPSRKSKIVVYCFHSISNDGWRFSVKKDMFEKQIKLLLKWGEPLAVRDLAPYLNGEKKVTQNMFVVTFDDGYEDVLELKDFVKKHSIFPAVFVLSNTEKVNYKELDIKKNFLSNNQIKELKQVGWDVGSHGATHPNFAKLSSDEIINEVVDSKSSLKKQLGFDIDFFAYPKGSYTQGTLQLVKDSGYKAAFSMDDKCITEKTDKFSIPRVGVDGTHSLKQFVNLALPLSMFFRKTVKTFI